MPAKRADIEANRLELIRPVAEIDVRAALEEDIGTGDCTAALIPADHDLNTRVVVRESAILAGRPWFDECFRQIDDRVDIEWMSSDGEPVNPDTVICTLRGPARAILSGERTALNFLQTLSATATQANRYVRAVEGTAVTILDTRKTLPGLRLAQKYAVSCGGAMNHRIGLFDAVLIKENHIAAAGSIQEAVHRALELFPEKLIEVEVENLQQLKESLKSGAQRVLLDNFEESQLRSAVKGFHGLIELEASGNINLDNVRNVADCGVDFISIGDITKSVKAIDFSMRFV
jgi:nicotinate-nucleotide pyrophosphorylase (carboxylating)